jgi:hypothetical protein
MTKAHEHLRQATAEAIRKACRKIAAEYGNDPIHGFSLCIDDDVTTLFAAVCTKAWVTEHEADDDAVGYIYTEWDQNSGDSLFDQISDSVAKLAEDEENSTPEQRFEALVLALQDCRNDGTFDADTLLCCGSTDPSDEMEKLAMQTVDRLNSREVADLFAEHLGYEHHRERPE